MFGIFLTERSRAAHDARNWLQLAARVLDFRRDELPAQETLAIQQASHDLATRLRERADAARLKIAIEKLEGCLRQSGGSHYPKSSLVDNVEFFLVAAIIVLGIRAFFVQPFKIPTNSMWPTYNGLTAEAYVDPVLQKKAAYPDSLGTVRLRPAADTPGPAGQALRLALLGASHTRVAAPAAGEIKIPWVFGQGLPSQTVNVRRWGILPGQAREYALVVGASEVRVRVPVEFRFEQLVLKVFFGSRDAFSAAELLAARARTGSRDPNLRTVFIPTGITVAAGDDILSFDILTGDQVFVDRLSYHFTPPKPGDAFVFRTDNIPFITSGRRVTQQYYVKRLVGAAGDVLEVRDHTLFSNGKPIEGAAAFEKNALREDSYQGYLNGDRLEIGETFTVPPESFFAMGDNSPDSADSRRWGPVPAADVIGKPLWIYYPFTKRWGLAR